MKEDYCQMRKKNYKECVFMLLVVILFIVPSVNLRASEVNHNTEYYSFSDGIIGKADEIQQSRFPNWLIFDWEATATQIIIYVHNIGLDTVDTISGTVTVENGTPIPFTAYNIAPLEEREIIVYVNMRLCYENIVVNYSAVDGGEDFGSGYSTGHREIPLTLSSIWVRGSFNSVYESINYHFYNHASEVGTTNIVEYATKAGIYRSLVIFDISLLSPDELNNKYTITVSIGTTPAHKYKHKTNLQYAILSDSGQYIVSYGK